MLIRKTVGIDLGTTNSVLALLDGARADFLLARDEYGQAIIPSLIGYCPKQQRIVVGRDAESLRSQARDAQMLPPASVKRYMGLDRTFPLGPELLQPAQVGSLVLRYLRERMARSVPDPRYQLDSAIVTMPAYFNHNQIDATRQAGELAGFHLVELLHEPTAAAIYYSWFEQHGDATYLVYDLGGGTFDVSVIRRRLSDFEVLGVSGDPFLGGDDFDRSLATFLIEHGRWTRNRSVVSREELHSRFEPTSGEGMVHFARLVQVGEGIKKELTRTDAVSRQITDFLPTEEGPVTLDATVDRAAFQALICDKVRRTIDCCNEALARARERAGIRLSQIDHVILVGGSTRVPLVGEMVRTAFCRPELPERVRNPDPLLHEPDLCVAFGAALRAATHGTRHVYSLPELNRGDSGEVELHWTSPEQTLATRYQATGKVRVHTPPTVAFRDELFPGGSVQIRSLTTGLIDEAFLDDRGVFLTELDLAPERDNPLQVTLCDADGRPLFTTAVTVRHHPRQSMLARAVLPTQIVTKPLQLEVLGRNRCRVKQIVVPVGSPLPGNFSCTCRTQDQSGRIVLPIFEENRIVRQLVIENLDPTLPIGTPVQVEFAIDVRYVITIKVRVAADSLGIERVESARIDPPPPPRCPTRQEVESLQTRIETTLTQLSGTLRTRMRGRLNQLREDLLEALGYHDEPRAIQRMAELTDLLQNLASARDRMPDPPWPQFSALVRECLTLANSVAEVTGRERQELFQYIHAQERYAEQAYSDHNQGLYRECRENLDRYGSYLRRLLSDALPRPEARPTLPPEEEAKYQLERFRRYLSSVWKEVRLATRDDLEDHLKQIVQSAQGLTVRIKSEASLVLAEVQRLAADVAWVQEQLRNKAPLSGQDDTGLLEASS